MGRRAVFFSIQKGKQRRLFHPSAKATTQLRTLIYCNEIITSIAQMKYRMCRTLRLSVETELGGIECQGAELIQVVRDILRKYESTGLASRYLRRDGKVGWRATEKLREELFEQEQEAIDEQNE
jgi:hypothetical protein